MKDERCDARVVHDRCDSDATWGFRGHAHDGQPIDILACEEHLSATDEYVRRISEHYSARLIP